MENWLEKNLALLSERQKDLAALISQASTEPVKIFASAKQLPTADYVRNSRPPLHLHSRYDPVLEARQTLEKIDLRGADFFILLGFGLGYILDALLDATRGSESKYFVIESELAILRAAMQARDLSAALTLPRVHFAWPVSGPELSRQWVAFFDPVLAQGSVFINHLPSIAVNPDFFKSAAQTIQSQTFQIFTDINTLVTKSKVFLDNFVENLPLALSSPGVRDFAGLMTGVPAVIVSAGPSLDRNIHELRGIEDRALVFSTDTALKPLMAAGVKPHFVLSGDPTEANYFHLKGVDRGAFLFVVEATAFPEVFREFRGRTITCMFEDSLLGSLSALLGQKGSLRAWGSVATMALDFALHLKCNPIIFAGQDLAYSEGRTYCSGLYWEEQVFTGVTTPEQWKERWDWLRAGKPTITMVDIFGSPVETTDKLSSYWNWINKEIQAHRETCFINATEGGILRDGLQIMSLREALYRHCDCNMALTQRTEELFSRARVFESRPVESSLASLRMESSNVHDLLSKGREICRAENERRPVQFTKSLESIKNSIYENQHLAPLLDSFNQLGNVAFLRKQAAFDYQVGKIGNFEPVRIAYLEYFDSLLKALDTVDSAFARLESRSTPGSG